MSIQALKTASDKAENLAQEVTLFWASSVGRTINKLEQSSLLVEWLVATEEALSLAVNARSWIDVDFFDNMLDECKLWLDHVNT